LIKNFDKNQQERLLQVLFNYVDQGTIELIRKFLKVGYIDIFNLVDRDAYSVVNKIPRASILSSICVNLYFNELDYFIGSFLKRYKSKFIDIKQDSIYYIRYADTFVLGFTFLRTEVLKIIKIIENFLFKKLFVQIDWRQTLLSPRSVGFTFLGTLIR
jgi:hypothetical protein